MSSIRVPRRLLDQLHQAAPPGVPLAVVIEAAVAAAGGTGVLRARVERRGKFAMTRARIARLRAERHPMVYLEPGQQVSLAEACGDWIRLLEEEGERSFDPVARTLKLRGAATRGATGTRSKIRFSRGGRPL